MTVPVGSRCPMCWRQKPTFLRAWIWPMTVIMVAMMYVGVGVRQLRSKSAKVAVVDISSGASAFDGVGSVGFVAPEPTVAKAVVLFQTPAPELTPPSDHPPLRVVAGAWVYTVHYTTRAYLNKNQCDGWSDRGKHEIWLAVDEDARSTMMHELMHVTMNMAADDGRRWVGAPPAAVGYEANHDYIAPAAPEMLELLRDNPRLVAWLSVRSGSKR